MDVIIGQKTVETDQIVISGQSATINGRTYNASHNVVIPVEDGFVDIFLLYANFSLIRKKLSFQSIDLIVLANSEDFSVQFDYDSVTLKNLSITMGDFYLYNFNESDLLVILSHELGHLIDIKNIYKSHINLMTKKKILRMTHIAVIILLTTILKNHNINSFLLTFLFLVMNAVQMLVINTLLRYKDALESRQQEYTADRYAVRVIGDLKLVLAAYEKMDTLLQNPVKTSFFSSHPTFRSRINHLKIRYWYLVLWNKIFSH